MRTLIIMTLILLGAWDASAQTSCLAYFDTIPRWATAPGSPGRHFPWLPGNADSVLVDTCSSSLTYSEMYLKKWFLINPATNILPLPAYSADTVLEVTWQSIDTAYDSTRSAFQALETKYGSFVLRKQHPDQTDLRTGGGVFLIRFLSNVCADSAIHDIEAITRIGQVDVIDSLHEPAAAVALNRPSPRTVRFWPNPARGSIHIDDPSDSGASLFTISGDRVRVWNQGKDLPLDGIPSGVYYLREGTATFKLIVE